MNWKITVAFVLFTGHVGIVYCFNNSSTEETKCMNSSASEFPDDFFTDYQRTHGALILHFLLAVYCFTLVAVVCDKYFLPSVECICTGRPLFANVAGATFMAVATSTPELFMNIIGTFITESDLGVGTVVGSALFNTLGVVSCIGLAAFKVIDLEWWPLTRDCSIYGISLIVLTVITYDERIEWYESMVLILMYLLYFLVMWANTFLMKIVTKFGAGLFGNRVEISEPDESISEVCSGVGPGTYRWNLHGDLSIINMALPTDVEKAIPKNEKEIPETKEEEVTRTWLVIVTKMAWIVFIWPIKFLLSISIPDCRKDKLRMFYPVTFIMCIIWIGVSSYVNGWMMTIIGSTIGVPDSVMGLTVLAAGGSMPEMFSSIIMARKGVGSMGISNSVGANTLNILLCLGLPWFIKGIIQLAETGDPSVSYVQIISEGVTYNCLTLFICVVILYSVVLLFHFKLGKHLGFTCLTIYLLCITFTVLSELNVFFHVNDPLCP
ncbi:hypothetical protein L9F63_014244 [Diploptera punctata]|uniref:Sodium/calcium exchanger membrane region domain-containing protein n=1 Tax=Diploptera punctata TaxID=6984 RepID=A0AAD8ELV3_DIPPU|nr:hypothetical protein L9F63_014244 [Diploptera punctata]